MPKTTTRTRNFGNFAPWFNEPEIRPFSLSPHRTFWPSNTDLFIFSEGHGDETQNSLTGHFGWANFRYIDQIYPYGWETDCAGSDCRECYYGG